jgi:hypothetical protein
VTLEERLEVIGKREDALTELITAAPLDELPHCG